MKNQEIKGKSCLTLEKLSDNELETVVGGSIKWENLMVAIMQSLLFQIDMSSNRKYKDIVAFAAACYLIYRGGLAVVRELKSKPPIKTTSENKSVTAAVVKLQV